MTTTTILSNPSDERRSIEDTRSTQARTPWQRIDWIILILLLLVGGALRFYQLGVTPPGFQFDEAFNAIDAEQVLEGNRPLFLPANGGREVLYTYFQAGLIALLGSSAWSFRLASALWGTAAVGTAYLLFRTMLRHDSRLIATLAAAALAISYWHIHFSHFGIRVITMPVIFSALIGVFWSAAHAPTRGRRLLYYVLAGVVLGASVWSNPTGRLAPIILIAWTAILLWREPAQRTLRIDAPLVGLLITGAIAFLVFLPLGITFWQNPEFFFGHASEVSVFAERVSGDSGPLVALLDNILHVLGMFSFYGDLEWTHGIPGRPILDWIIAIPFYIGIIIWAMRLFGRNRRGDIDGDALWLLAVWVVVMLAPSVLSDAAPNYSRTLPALPAALLPIGLGLAWIIRRPWPARWLGYGLAGAILVGSLVWTFYDYFVRFPQMQQTYYTYDVDKADALEILRQHSNEGATGAQVYLSPLWAEHAPVRWMRGGSGIKTLEPAQTLALPAGRGALFAYTGEEGVKAQALAERINQMFADIGSGESVSVEEIRDHYDKPLLWLVTLSAEQAAGLHLAGDSAHLPAHFDDAPTLLAATMDAQGALLFEWRAEAPTFRDLTAFAHYIDRNGNRVAQVDRIPGDGSFATPFWMAGERVIDRLMPAEFAPCTTGEPVRVVTGWYEYAADGARRVRVDAPGDLALAGTFTLPARALTEAEIAAATGFASPRTFGARTLLGYTLQPEGTLQQGQAFTVDLYYRAEAAAPSQVAYALLEARDGADAGQVTGEAGEVWLAALDEGDVGETLCQRLHLAIPAHATGGNHTLFLEMDDGDRATLVDLSVETAPARAPIDASLPPIDARLETGIRLHSAVAVSLEETQLEVTINWIADAAGNAARYPATVFVQLLTPEGVFVVGSDVQPAPQVQDWVTGEVYTTESALTLPADLAAGEYSLVAGMYDALTLERIPVDPSSIGETVSVENDAIHIAIIPVD